MSRSMSGLLLAAAVVWGMAVAPQAQTSTSQETKAFTVLAVNGNQLIVRLPEGTRELMVPEDFLFTINGKQMNVRQLKAGMQGTATITTRTTVTPVSVTEVKNGTVVVRNSAGIIVRTDEGVRSFTQSDVDKRGVQVYRDGAPVQVAQLREGDRLSATIVTSLPPRVMTEQEVNATLATAKAASGSAAPAAAPAAEAGCRWHVIRWRDVTRRHCSIRRHGGTCAERLGVAVVRVWRRRQDAAEHRQLVAPPRARGRPVPRDRRRADDEAPPQQLADWPDKAAFARHRASAALTG